VAALVAGLVAGISGGVSGGRAVPVMKPYDSEGWLHLLLLLLRTTRHTATHTRVSVAIFEPSPRPLVPAAFVPAAFEPASRSCPRRSCERSSPRPAWPRELSEAAMPPKGSKLSDVLNASHVAKHKAKPVVKPGRSLKTRTTDEEVERARHGNFVVGKPAFDKYLTAAQTKEKGKEVTLDDMDPLHVYIWLASDEQKTEIQRISAVIYGAATGTAKKKAAKAPVSSKKAKVEVQEDDPLMELFK